MFERPLLERFYQRVLDLSGPVVPSEPYLAANNEEEFLFCHDCFVQEFGEEAADGIEVDEDEREASPQSVPDAPNCDEVDKCLHCSMCGDLLEYSLSDAGIEAELDEAEADLGVIDERVAQHLLPVLTGLQERNPNHIEFIDRIESLAIMHFSRTAVPTDTVH